MIKLTGNFGSVYIDPTKVIGIETTRLEKVEYIFRNLVNL